METIQWHHFLAAFFAGGILSNAIPHFVQGISGNKFPTPFSKPHGRGLSSPLVNTLWALFNLVIGYFLFLVSHVSLQNKLLLLVFFIGFLEISIWSSINFTKKEKE